MEEYLIWNAEMVKKDKIIFAQAFYKNLQTWHALAYYVQ